MALFDLDLNQPISWWEEEEIVEDQYDGTVQDLSYGLVCGESDQACSLQKTAQFDLNQPIKWEEEEMVKDQYDGTVQDLRHGLVRAESDQDKEERVDDLGHGGAGHTGDWADGQGKGADRHEDYTGNGGAGSDADGFGAAGFGGVASDADSTGRGLDLNKIANTKRRTQYTDDERRAVWRMLLKRNGGSSSTIKRGVSKAVATEMEMPVRTVQRVWLVGRCGGGIDAVVSKKAKNCGRKRIEADPEAIRGLPKDGRMTIRELAKALRMNKTTVFRRLKEGRLRRPGK